MRYSIQHCETGSDLHDSAETLIRSWIAKTHTINNANEPETSERVTNRTIENSRIIVYCHNLQDFQELRVRLNCPIYLKRSEYVSTDERDKAIQQWHAPEGIPVILVAGSSCNLDYPSVRCVIDVGAPSDMYHFTRNSSLAGRDGEVAESIILLQPPTQLNPNNHNPSIDSLMQRYIEGEACLRETVSRYVEESRDKMSKAFGNPTEFISNEEALIRCVDGQDQLCSVCMSLKEILSNESLA